MPDYSVINAKERELQPLWNRMDVDRDLYYLTPYTLRDNKGATVEGIINVTLNIPATFAAHFFSSILSAAQQVVVDGDSLGESIQERDVAAGKIEDILNALVQEGDRRLRAKGQPLIRPFTTEQIGIRGRTSTRITFRKDASGGLIADFLPLDTRWFTYEMGEDPDTEMPVMLWGAYKTWRWRADIIAEYPDAASIIPAQDTQLIAVTDYWDKDVNNVFLSGSADNQTNVSGRQIFTQLNPYGYPPFTLQLVPLGSMLKGKDDLAHYGESIFFLIRDLIPELNRLASIMQTLNQASAKPAYDWENVGGVLAEVPDSPKLGDEVAADMGGGHKLIPMGDLKAAGRLLHDILSRAIQSGSLSNVDFGNTQFPLSAVAIIELGESSGQVFLPRLGAKGLLFQQNAEMMIAQLKQLRFTTISLGPRGHKTTYNMSDLEGEYDITYQYTVKSPATDSALFAIAEVAERWFDDHTILATVMHVENPTEILEAKRSQNAELNSPTVRMYREIKALIHRGETIAARLMAADLEDLAGIPAEELLGISPLGDGTNEPKPQPARNALNQGRGTRAGSNKKASDLMGAGAAQGPEGGGGE